MEIVRTSGEVEARVTDEWYSAELVTIVNGRQSTGQPITPTLARLTIAVLREYLDKLDGEKR